MCPDEETAKRVVLINKLGLEQFKREFPDCIVTETYEFLDDEEQPQHEHLKENNDD
jgi:hypothetical protein